jgi:hypothetical protein
MFHQKGNGLAVSGGSVSFGRCQGQLFFLVIRVNLRMVAVRGDCLLIKVYQ